MEVAKECLAYLFKSSREHDDLITLLVISK